MFFSRIIAIASTIYHSPIAPLIADVADCTVGTGLFGASPFQSLVVVFSLGVITGRARKNQPRFKNHGPQHWKHVFANHRELLIGLILASKAMMLEM